MAAYHRLAAKKYIHKHLYPHHGHNHSRIYSHTQPHPNSFLNSYLNSEKNCCATPNPHMMSMRQQPPINDYYMSLDRAAYCHRNAACKF